MMPIPVYVQNRILSRCSGASTAAVDMETLAVLKDFCSRTGVWHYTDTQDLTATGVYTLTPPAGASVSAIERVTVDTSTFQPWSESDRAPKQPPRSYSLDTDQITLTIHPAPTATVVGGLVVYARLIPADASSIPTRVFAVNEDAILAGVLANMYAIPNRPYTSPPAALRMARQYMAGCAQARRNVLANQSSASVSWRFPTVTNPLTRRRG